VKKLLGAAGLLLVLANSTYAADGGLAIVQDFATKWQDGYNSGDATKVFDLYATDAVLSSGILGTIKGKPEIERVVAAQIKKNPTIKVAAVEGHQVGSFAWGYGDFTFPNGSSGHFGYTLVSDGGTWHIVQHVSNVMPKKE
jgi:hypothetical protein